MSLLLPALNSTFHFFAHVVILARSLFSIEAVYSTEGPDRISVVSSANIIGSDSRSEIWCCVLYQCDVHLISSSHVKTQCILCKVGGAPIELFPSSAPTQPLTRTRSKHVRILFLTLTQYPIHTLTYSHFITFIHTSTL